MGGVALQFAADEVAGDDAARFAVDDDELHHFVAGVHFHAALGDLAREGRIGTQKQLLAGLALGVEGAAHLHSAKRAVVQQTAVIAGKGNPLSDTLVDDAGRYFGQTVDVGFAAAVVTAFNRVVEEAEGRISVVLVVFCGVDTPLSGDRVRAARRILEAKSFDVVP